MFAFEINNSLVLYFFLLNKFGIGTAVDIIQFFSLMIKLLLFQSIVVLVLLLMVTSLKISKMMSRKFMLTKYKHFH